MSENGGDRRRGSNDYALLNDEDYDDEYSELFDGDDEEYEDYDLIGDSYPMVKMNDEKIGKIREFTDFFRFIGRETDLADRLRETLKFITEFIVNLDNYEINSKKDLIRKWNGLNECIARMNNAMNKSSLDVRIAGVKLKYDDKLPPEGIAKVIINNINAIFGVFDPKERWGRYGNRYIKRWLDKYKDKVSYGYLVSKIREIIGKNKQKNKKRQNGYGDNSDERRRRENSWGGGRIRYSERQDDLDNLEETGGHGTLDNASSGTQNDLSSEENNPLDRQAKIYDLLKKSIRSNNVGSLRKVVKLANDNAMLGRKKKKLEKSIELYQTEYEKTNEMIEKIFGDTSEKTL